MPSIEEYLGSLMDNFLGVVQPPTDEVGEVAGQEVDTTGVPTGGGGGSERVQGRVAPDTSGSSGVVKGSLAWGGFDNGRIPQDQLMRVGDVHYQGEASHFFEPSAGSAFQAMRQAAVQDGVSVRLTDSYRSFDTQVSLRRRKGGQVATADPGTSIHGWGRAIDVANDEAREWIQRNGSRFGWVWPDWAQRKGTKSFEPWHFEFRGGGNTQSNVSTRERQAESAEETISRENVRQALHGRS